MPTISFSGIASGIDGEAIIKALLDARKLANRPIEAKVENNTNETDALSEFNTRLLKLDSSLKDFLTLTGGAVSKTAASSDDNVVSASATSAATAGSVGVTVKQLAKNAVISFADRFASASTPIAPGLAGPADIQLTVGSGASQETFTVSIDSTTTLTDLVQKVNEGSGGRVLATTINAGTAAAPQYVFVLNGTETGTEKGTLSVQVPAGLGALQSPTISQADDAILDVTGVGEVRRPSNSVTDLIPGVTLDLKSVSASPMTITVRNDADKTAKKLSELIGAINEAIKYSKDNSKIERVEENNQVQNVFGTLARTRIDEQFIDSLRGAISSANSGIAGSEIQIFADIGVTTERDGTLKFDEAKFNEAVQKDGAAVENVLQSFADAAGTTNGLISQYTRFQGFIDMATKANEEENSSLNDRLARMDEMLEQQKATLEKMFSNLEQKVGRLNSSASALSGILAGLGAK